ncbi:MAG: fatty acid desaturase [Planctomycetia bacterium]|nr:fatty acid desaturase [Planctomycetia bacterium]
MTTTSLPRRRKRAKSHPARLPKARGRHPILWAYTLPIVIIHALALLACIPWLFSWTGLAVMLVGVHMFGNLGINLGYHRLLTHRSFQTPKWLEHCFSVVALCCMQDTPARWVATHRLHHSHADGPDDPHSPLDDFVWGHIGWLFRRSPALHDIALYQTYARDLLADPFYMRLEKRPALAGFIYLAHAALFFLVGLVGGRLWWGDWAAGLQFGASLLVWGVIVRTVVVWHITWSVNSVTHMFGYRSYDTPENSRNNWLVAVLSAGEGWHNNHHWDPSSARVQHRWWELDTTFYTIWLLEKVGLAWAVIAPRHSRRTARDRE